MILTKIHNLLLLSKCPCAGAGLDGEGKNAYLWGYETQFYL